MPDYCLFQSLIAGPALADARRRTDTRPSWKRWTPTCSSWRSWADNCPENFAHKHKLAAAEIARLRGAPLEEVIALYDEAVAGRGRRLPAHEGPGQRAAGGDVARDASSARSPGRSCRRPTTSIDAGARTPSCASWSRSFPSGSASRRTTPPSRPARIFRDTIGESSAGPGLGHQGHAGRSPAR